VTDRYGNLPPEVGVGNELGDARILDLARKTLDRGLYFGACHVTRAIDPELLAFARAILADTVADLNKLERNMRLAAVEFRDDQALHYYANQVCNIRLHIEAPNADDVADAIIKTREIK
jgi:hypothetical protein